MGFKARGPRTCGGCGSKKHDIRKCPAKAEAKPVKVVPQQTAPPTTLEERLDDVVEEWKREQIRAALERALNR